MLMNAQAIFHLRGSVCTGGGSGGGGQVIPSCASFRASPSSVLSV